MGGPAIALVGLAMLLVAVFPRPAQARRLHCHLRNMSLVNGAVCVDRYESVTQERRGNRWVSHSPFESVRGKQVRAITRKGLAPQAYISRNEAEAACGASGKRLCTDSEWLVACKGKSPTLYPYGNVHRNGRCNDAGVSPLNHFFGNRDGPPASAYGWGPMNDPRLNQLRGTVAPAGSFPGCRNAWGLYDMVGNLHEWTANPGGTFRGGYYLDTKINGEGCDYKTVAHSPDYHDYSTGFRCCADPR